MRTGVDCKGREWEENPKKLSPDKDLVGKVFGKLTVLFRVQNDSNGNSYWLAQCKCGNKVVARGTGLRDGHARSCGCSQAEFVSEKLTKQIFPGEQFGYWTVLYRANGYIGNGSYWRCRCRCGVERDVVGENLSNGMSKSCGCYGKELKSEKNTIDLTGRVYGFLTVLGRSDKKVAGEILWNVRCECGTEKMVSGHNLRRGGVISCGCKQCSIGEMNVSHILENNNITFQPQYTFSDLVTEKNKSLRFDFAILGIYDDPIRLIEFDGMQHFMPIERFGGEEAFKKQQSYDLIKNQYALSHNIPLVRIPYSKRDSMCIDDLLGDKYLIKENDLNGK